ncbi:MAG: hypothetical protein D8M59_07725 [Planctomycetes bacterium]|nr:hypothetical protein [Planctomycetota bacterium]
MWVPSAIRLDCIDVSSQSSGGIPVRCIAHQLFDSGLLDSVYSLFLGSPLCFLRLPSVFMPSTFRCNTLLLLLMPDPICSPDHTCNKVSDPLLKLSFLRVSPHLLKAGSPVPVEDDAQSKASCWRSGLLNPAMTERI